MRIVTTWQGLEPLDRGASVAMGNFDGLHVGHQSVIAQAAAAGRPGGAPLGVITFEPHPREVFAPDAPPFRLMNRAARAHRMEKLGVERLYELPFSKDLAAMTPEGFVDDVLVGGLGVAHVVVGADFHFGKGRAGDAQTLVDLGHARGFGVTIARLVQAAGEEVSSTAIRRALTEGRPRDAHRMLGHWHRIEGAVLHGDKRGRDLGFPTANMAIAGLHPPHFGVYAVKADVLTGPHAGSYLGAASLGVRPMFGVNTPNLETYLFDFSGDLYGAEMSVALVEYLRPEMTFDGLDGLIAQMNADCARARDVLAAV
ncbi:bifunctional riboflavin kinase/FAD synthetase [Acidimangrovimonas sediminis]|uniref:bifunctional riboflavin kinase/FAD synthetase n=1 Tax=Acidimangrovimonas sediminis TaxID=2056283 RepID=UPI000C7FE7D2|nr:bifunctional riboflavin kinase/FAD synthetase [Acidimangrovimonas sediminis]